mgnify:CR=1 FL=1
MLSPFDPEVLLGLDGVETALLADPFISLEDKIPLMLGAASEVELRHAFITAPRSTLPNILTAPSTLLGLSTQQ